MSGLSDSAKVKIGNQSVMRYFLDCEVITAFVNFMLAIDLKSEDMICASIPSIKIPNGEDIFDYLNNVRNGEIFVFSFRQLLFKPCLFE